MTIAQAKSRVNPAVLEMVEYSAWKKWQKQLAVFLASSAEESESSDLDQYVMPLLHDSDATTQLRC